MPTSRHGIELATPPITPTVRTQTQSYPGELIVACVYWGNKYPVEYVYKLKSMVERRLKAPHRFVCLSDKDIEGVDCIPVFAKSFKGWWQKVCLFMPKLFPRGSRIFYMDLDVVVTGELDDMVCQTSAEPLTMIYNFGPNRGHCAHNSSVMLWTAGDPRVEGIYTYFSEDVMQHLHGDQCWIWRVLRDQISNWPDAWVKSYKYDLRGKGLPQDCRVVVFHGDPKPHNVLTRESWVEANWHDMPPKPLT